MADRGRFYDDAYFGHLQVAWLGLPVRYGGPNAGAGITFNETQSNVVKRWYPPIRGRIVMQKARVMTLATLGKGEQSFRLSKGATTAAAAFATLVASTTSAPWTIASKIISTTLAAGSYVSIMASTNVCSTGTVAIGITWRPMFQGGATQFNLTDSA